MSTFWVLENSLDWSISKSLSSSGMIVISGWDLQKGSVSLENRSWHLFSLSSLRCSSKLILDDLVLSDFCFFSLYFFLFSAFLMMSKLCFFVCENSTNLLEKTTWSIPAALAFSIAFSSKILRCYFESWVSKLTERLLRLWSRQNTIPSSSYFSLSKPSISDPSTSSITINSSWKNQRPKYLLTRVLTANCARRIPRCCRGWRANSHLTMALNLCHELRPLLANY